MSSSRHWQFVPAPLRALLGQAAERARAVLIDVSNTRRRRRHLNVGGGPWFAHPGWYNLEDVPSLVNRSPYRLSPNGVWPFPDASLDTVYTSHVLEHLSDETVEGVLKQAYRVLVPGGRLVICIPDFDRALACWRTRDPSFFCDRSWDYSQVSDTWKNRNVPDTLDYRAAFLFCGFWNAEYGHPFKRRFLRNERAYHGPPLLPEEMLGGLAGSSTPRGIARTLRDWVLCNETGIQFNHQNAWSRAELSALLERHAFRIASFDPDSVIETYRDVPRVSARLEQSTFCLAVKP